MGDLFDPINFGGPGIIDGASRRLLFAPPLDPLSDKARKLARCASSSLGDLHMAS